MYFTFAMHEKGGIITGLSTGFFSTSRVHTPINLPLSSTLLPKLHRYMSSSVILSSTLWRVAKRTLLSTILFAVLECDFRDVSFISKESYQSIYRRLVFH